MRDGDREAQGGGGRSSGGSQVCDLDWHRRHSEGESYGRVICDRATPQGRSKEVRVDSTPARCVNSAAHGGTLDQRRRSRLACSSKHGSENIKTDDHQRRHTRRGHML